MPQNNVDSSKFLARPVVIIAAASRSSAIQDPADKLYGPFRRAAMLADDLGAAYDKAGDAIESGAAKQKLDDLVTATS